MPRPRRLTEAESRDLLIRRGELTALGNHPAWPVLLAAIEEHVADLERQMVAATLHAGEDAPIPVEKLIRLRGYIAGMRYVAQIPSYAQTQLERNIRQQGAAA